MRLFDFFFNARTVSTISIERDRTQATIREIWRKGKQFQGDNDATGPSPDIKID